MPQEGNEMSKVFRCIVVMLTIVFVVGASMFGALAAYKVSQFSLGDDIYISSLEEEDSHLGMINILLIGTDEGGYRSDTIMLVSVDGYSNRVNLLSIPRDTKVKAQGYATNKINALMGLGQVAAKSGKLNEPEELLINMVKELTRLPVHYFVTVDLDGFKDLIDALGGVDFNVPYNMNYDDPVQNLHIHLKAGQQHLNGQSAHDFVRFRHNNGGSAPGEYAMGDEGREYWQQEFLKELVRQKCKPQYIAKIDDIFRVIKTKVRSNYTMKDLLSHLDLVQKLDLENIGSYQLPGESKYTQISGYPEPLWWYIYDAEKTEELINEVFLPKSTEQWEEYKATHGSEDSKASGFSALPASVNG